MKTWNDYKEHVRAVDLESAYVLRHMVRFFLLFLILRMLSIIHRCYPKMRSPFFCGLRWFFCRTFWEGRNNME